MGARNGTAFLERVDRQKERYPNVAGQYAVTVWRAAHPQAARAAVAHDGPAADLAHEGPSDLGAPVPSDAGVLSGATAADPPSPNGADRGLGHDPAPAGDFGAAHPRSRGSERGVDRLSAGRPPRCGGAAAGVDPGLLRVPTRLVAPPVSGGASPQIRP